jgi:zinc/manganese transport system substrate-binding protein
MMLFGEFMVTTPMRLPFARALFPLLFTAALTSSRAELKVASLSTITTDLARQIGGTNVKVTGIVRPGVDPHEFEPTPADVKMVADANLVLYAGKGLEGYLTKLEEAAGGSSKFVNVGKDVPSLTISEDLKTMEDPHWWHSVGNMKQAVHVVAEGFEQADPKHASDYKRNADAYLSSLSELERWIRVQLAELPRGRRKLVTSHDALGYFARDYGFKIYPVKGVNTNEDPSSQHVKQIIAVIRDQGVRSVFFETIENPRAVSQISAETGAMAGGALYSDGLGETPEANTYITMMRHNVAAIVNGLK